MAKRTLTSNCTTVACSLLCVGVTERYSSEKMNEDNLMESQLVICEWSCVMDLLDKY